MAKKAVQKKRKSQTALSQRSSKEAPEGQTLGWVTIPVQCSAYVGDNITAFDELVIEWACLGLSEEPDKISEVSGNSGLLHPDRPPATDEEGLHVFFKSPLPHGTYGFLFNFTYYDSVHARTADPKLVEKLAEAREKQEAAPAAEVED